ncbi:hypothetical protein Sulfitobl28_23480 [Sulfitobacter pontiacus]|nr:hypothetical protein Sulfitobl28_23480 [Sulfitobacter pontiacus]
MFPAQALAEVMLARGWRVKLSTDARGARYTGGFPEAVEIQQVSSATFARGGLVAKAIAPFRILGGVLGGIFGMLRDKPDVVVGFGGYPSIPALTAAWVLRKPRMIHEQNGVLGRVNDLFSKHVDAVACGTWPTTLPDGVSAEHTGNPVRAAVLERAGAGYIAPGDYPMELLVMGGSQGARILSEVIPPPSPICRWNCCAISVSAIRRGTRMASGSLPFTPKTGSMPMCSRFSMTCRGGCPKPSW